MRLFRKKSTPHNSSNISLATPTDSRRSSKIITAVITPLDSQDWSDHHEKRPDITMMPRDSAASFSSDTSRNQLRRIQSTGPYCPKRPSLQEILNNEASEPWTLQAFTDYCAANLCLENVTFLQEAERYTQRFMGWLEHRDPSCPELNEVEKRSLSSHFRNILEDFIATGGPQEVNLDSNAKNTLLSIPEADYPPCPDKLGQSVRLTKRLIEDSILFTFLNTVSPHNCSDENMDLHYQLDVQPHKPRHLDVTSHPRDSRPSTKDSKEMAPNSSPPHAHSFGNAFQSRMMKSGADRTRSKSPRRRKTMFSSTAQKVESHPDVPSIDALMLEDSTSTTATPVHSNDSLASPPMSPIIHPRSERPSKERTDSGWKKLGARLGFKRKGSNNHLQHLPEQAIEESPRSSPRSSPKGDAFAARAQGWDDAWRR